MKREIEILDKQILISIIFIVTIVISIILTYDEKQYKLKRKTIFSPKTDKYINLLNRILSLAILFYLLYLNYETYQIAKQKGRNLHPFKHQIQASILSTIAGIIVLYVVFENWYENPNITTLENPII